MNVAGVRAQLRKQYSLGEFVQCRGSRTVEIVAASFAADEDSVFGAVNAEYVRQELEWYNTMSLRLFPGAPEIWRTCAGRDGEVNSNYGWCMFGCENGLQYAHVAAELRRDPGSRRAVAVYTRPTMHVDAVMNGKQDFMCTNAVQYLLRGGALHCVVQMRSSDAVLGYRNDLAWHKYVLAILAADLGAAEGCIYWQAGSLHVYERHFRYLR